MGLKYAHVVQQEAGERRIQEFQRQHFVDFEHLLSDIQLIIDQANRRGSFSVQYFLPGVKLGSRALGSAAELMQFVTQQLRKYGYHVSQSPVCDAVLLISWSPSLLPNPFADQLASQHKLDPKPKALKKTVLDKTNLDKTNLDKTNLDKTNLDKTNLDKTNLDKTVSNETGSEKTNLDKTNLEKTVLEKTVLEKTNLDKIDETVSNETTDTACTTQVPQFTTDKSISPHKSSSPLLKLHSLKEQVAKMKQRSMNRSPSPIGLVQN